MFLEHPRCYILGLVRKIRRGLDPQRARGRENTTMNNNNSPPYVSPGKSCALTRGIPSTAPWRRCCSYSHLPAEQTEAQSGQKTVEGSTARKGQRAGLWSTAGRVCVLSSHDRLKDATIKHHSSRLKRHTGSCVTV